jgi:TPR repeat protein
MDNNILLETTVKTFENGIDEVKSLKASLVKLSDVIKELLEFNEIFNLDIDAIKLDEVKNNIDNIILEQKKLSKQYRDSINKLKKSQENDLDKLTHDMDIFLIEAENLSEKIRNISQSINIDKIEEISKQSNEFLESIKNQYTDIGIEFNKINDLGNGIENLKKSVEEVNEKVKSEDIGEKVCYVQAIITEFELNYHKLNEKYGKLNEDIYNSGSKNIEDLIGSIGKLYNTADEFHKKLLSLDRDLETKELQNKCKSTNIMINKIYEDIESDYKVVHDEYENFRKIPISLKEFEETLVELQSKLSKDELQENTENVLRILDNFKIETHEKSAKYFELSKSVYEQSINNIKDIQNAIVQVENQASKFQVNISDLYNIMSSERFLNLAREVNEQMEALNSKCSEISSNFENLINIDIDKNNIIEEIKLNRDATKSIEERMATLEEKIIFLIDENQNLRKLYSQKNNIDNEFQNQILSVIKENIQSVSNIGNCTNNDEENIEDKHMLGLHYLKRYDDNEDLKKAIELFEISSEQDNNESSYNLAEIYYYGKGVEKDLKLALQYYLKAANNGHNKSVNKIIEIYEGKANNGEVEYSRFLGDIYLKGKIINGDIQKAIKWYEVSAEGGNKDSVNMLIRLYESLASKNNANAKFRLGEIYYGDQWGNKDNFKAFKWYLSAEEQGYFKAKNKAGQVAYDIGEGIFYSDVNKSIEWYKIAAEKGNAEAQYKLGDIYHKGKFVTKDEERAVMYYQMAADQGHLLALTQIKIVKPFSKFFK